MSQKVDDRENLNLSDLNRPSLCPILVVLNPRCILEAVENTVACGLVTGQLAWNSGVGSAYDILISFFPNILLWKFETHSHFEIIAQ